jgi:sugar/nucleoside kinase (ribokinase family)
VAGELRGAVATAFQADTVGALGQGWLRAVDEDGQVSPREWADPGTDLSGVHVLFLSENDLPEADAGARELLAKVPIVALTRGWRGATLFSREATFEVPGFPREEVDPTGAGDVFAAAFLLRYHEAGDLVEAASFAACAASCVVEGVGASSLGDRAEVESRQRRLQRMIEEGEWEE